MKTDYVIDETFIGQTIGPENGFLVNLKRTQASPPGYEVPNFDPGRQQWKTARFVLRGTKDIRDLVCCDAQSGGGVNGLGGGELWTNANIAYLGELEVVCLPRGSVWQLTISDQPNIR